MTLFINSCLLLDFIDIFSPNDPERKMEVFIENKTDETLMVLWRGIELETELARILKNEIKKLIVIDTQIIYIAGGNSRKEYREIKGSPGMTYTITKYEDMNINTPSRK